MAHCAPTMVHSAVHDGARAIAQKKSEARAPPPARGGQLGRRKSVYEEDVESYLKGAKLPMAQNHGPLTKVKNGDAVSQRTVEENRKPLATHKTARGPLQEVMDRVALHVISLTMDHFGSGNTKGEQFISRAAFLRAMASIGVTLAADELERLFAAFSSDGPDAIDRAALQKALAANVAAPQAPQRKLPPKPKLFTKEEYPTSMLVGPY